MDTFLAMRTDTIEETSPLETATTTEETLPAPLAADDLSVIEEELESDDELETLGAELTEIDAVLETNATSTVQ